MTRRIGLLFFLILVLFVPSPGLCLDTIVGMKGGAGVFSYLGEDYEDFLDTYNLTNDRKWGFAAGVSVALELSEVFVLQPEI